MTRRRLPGLLILVWVLAISISYFIVHQIKYNPLGEQGVVMLGRLALDVVAVIALLVLSGALGTLLLRRLDHLLSDLEQGVIGHRLVGILSSVVAGMVGNG